MTEPRHTTRRWLDVVLDVLAVAGIVVVLAFPAAAVLSTEPAPRLTDPAVALPPLRQHPAGATLRDVPAFTAGGDVARAIADGRLLTDQPTMERALDDQSRAVFGDNGDGGLLSLTRDHTTFVGAAFTSGAGVPPLSEADPILDATLGSGALPAAMVPAVNDLAGLLVHAAVQYPAAFPNAARVAYDLYDRARQTDACEPQLNLAFLLSADTSSAQFSNRTTYNDTVAEFGRAGRDCPTSDPTSQWLLGQFQSGQQHAGPARATFEQLERRFPGSPLGWSGEADALVRQAYRLDVPAPFSARADFRRARALFQRATALDPGDRGLTAGAARASAGLRDFEDAVRRQRRALTHSAAAVATSFRTRLVGYLEGSGRFAAAARAQARALETEVTTPPGPALIGKGPDFFDEVSSEDALGPISFGAERLRPVQLQLGLQALPLIAGASDISFIPPFRAVSEVTNATGGCRHSRDLLLAGRTAAALADIPTRCASTGGLLARIAEFEQEDRADATASVDVLDADQNLWRFAGKLGHAAAAAMLWSRLAPTDPRGPDQAGEIAYLRKRYQVAAGFFAEAAKRSSDEILARELLKEGTAREMAGDTARARQLLHDADAAASGIITADVTGQVTRDIVGQALLDSYNARLQAGDTELRDHRFAAAEVQYEKARERESQLPSPAGIPTSVTSRHEQLFRPEVLENNQALVLVQLDRADEALKAIDAAVKMDRENPIFLANKGFVEEKLGDVPAAEAAYRAALASDPTAFPAANNLGEILADDGHLSLAADAFRRALAANPEYATAAFNLGLVLDRMGPSHVLESQGELAVATRLEPELRERDHELITDDDTFFTTLDLSKPLPPNWHFASSQQRTSITVAGVVLALLLFRLFKTFIQDRAQEKATEHALQASTDTVPSRFATAGARIPGAVALIAVVAVFLYPLTRSSGTTTGDFLLVGIGVTATTFAFMRLRSAIARRHAVHTQHYPCLPAVAVGGAAALLGFGYAPMPATKSDEALPRHARWIGTGLLGALALVLLVVGRFSGVPFATQLGVVCLVMTSSALIPVEPYDGVSLEKHHVGLIIVMVIAAVGVLLELGVL